MVVGYKIVSTGVFSLGNRSPPKAAILLGRKILQSKSRAILRPCTAPKTFTSMARSGFFSPAADKIPAR